MIFKRRNKIVYVSGKYSDTCRERIIRNVEIARRYSSKIWDMGYTALSPIQNTALFEDIGKTNWKGFLDGDKELVRRSDALFMMNNWQDSKGAKLERQWALSQGKWVFYSLSQLNNWEKYLTNDTYSRDNHLRINAEANNDLRSKI